MSKKRNEAVSTTDTRCPRCGAGVTDLKYHEQRVDTSWTVAQMHNDPDKKYICQQS